MSFQSQNFQEGITSMVSDIAADVTGEITYRHGFHWLVVLLWLHLVYLSDYLCLCLKLFWCLARVLKTRIALSWESSK